MEFMMLRCCQSCQVMLVSLKWLNLLPYSHNFLFSVWCEFAFESKGWTLTICNEFTISYYQWLMDVCVCACFQREWPSVKEESISRIQMMKMRVGVVHLLSDLFKNTKIYAERAVVVLLLAEVCKVYVRSVNVKLSHLHAHILWVQMN